MSLRISLKQQLENFKAGMYAPPDRKTQISAGWYDWFCKDTALAGKTKKLYGKVKMISKSKKFDPEKVYVFFKNNCPCYGKLYDDFRICEFDTPERSGDVLFTVTPVSGHEGANGLGEVWGKANDFDAPLFTGTWKEIKAWFLTEPSAPELTTSVSVTGTEPSGV